MISFRSFLTEARMAPLYHGTTFDNARAIFIAKAILPKTEHRSRKLLLDTSKRIFVNGISTTRSFAFAKEWGGVIFELDQQKLIQKYKIIPVNFWQSTAISKARETTKTYNAINIDNESEEFILTNKYIPLGYVTKVWFQRRFLKFEWLEEYIEEFIKYFGKDNVKIYD